jgi:hypothetical protein
MEMLEDHLCINGDRDDLSALEHDDNRPYLNFIDFPKLQVLPSLSPLLLIPFLTLSSAPSPFLNLPLVLDSMPWSKCK